MLIPNKGNGKLERRGSQLCKSIKRKGGTSHNQDFFFFNCSSSVTASFSSDSGYLPRVMKTWSQESIKTRLDEAGIKEKTIMQYRYSVTDELD